MADRFDVTISSINRVIRRLTYFLSNLAPDIIKWPTNAEKLINEEYFRTNGFPNVIGAIDGSHVKIDKPEADPDSYINRKGYYSIQVPHKLYLIAHFFYEPNYNSTYNRI